MTPALLPMPPVADGAMRIATYNIHKGVRGLGPQRRLEIHNLEAGVAALQADFVFLQEVRSFHDREALHFKRSSFGWPEQGQAHFLAPEGYEVAYHTNAVTRGGEHGNALLSRWPLGETGHHDVSDHRFEQRGLLHVTAHCQGRTLHLIVAHLGLMHRGRVRQVARIARFIDANVPAGESLIVAGDFNDWGERLDGSMREMGLARARADGGPAVRTFPSSAPVFTLDRIYTRGFRCVDSFAPRGRAWARMSDHLPLVAELVPG